MAKSDSTAYSKMPKDNHLMVENRNADNNHFLFSTAYLGPVSYYHILNRSDHCFIEQYEYYEKQSYRNRCRIATANGVMDLSIPVEKQKARELIRDVRISDHTDWQTMHWRSIEAAYNSSPFFEYYSDDLHPFFEKKWVFLWDFNMQLHNVLAGLLNIENKAEFTDRYIESELETIVDLRNRIHPKKNNLLQALPYYQVFEQKTGFIPGLSIIDLLFNMGNESLLILNQDPVFI